VDASSGSDISAGPESSDSDHTSVPATLHPVTGENTPRTKVRRKKQVQRDIAVITAAGASQNPKAMTAKQHREDKAKRDAAEKRKGKQMQEKKRGMTETMGLEQQVW
jgi:hypothetical protein